MTGPPDSFATVSRAGLLATEVLGEAPDPARLSALRNEPILLVIDPARAATRSGQLMLTTAASIIGRLFHFAPAIHVAAPGAATLPGLAPLAAGRPLDAEIVALLDALVPPSPSSLHRATAGTGRYGVALAIGDPPVNADSVVQIEGEGWRARVRPASGSAALAAGPFNPFGPLVAAALGATEVAKHVFGRLAPDPTAFPALEQPLDWDLWQHGFGTAAAGPPLPPALGLGRIAVAGLGALGAAAVWALAQVEDARGTVELVDDDVLAATNLERVLTAYARDVGLPKVQVAARALAATHLRAVPFAARYGIEPPRGARATTVLCGVDSGAGRRQLQRLFPHAIYNGGTDGAELLVSRHVASTGPCLECLYPEIDDPVARTAARLGVDRSVAAALLRGERHIDGDVLDAIRRRGGVHLEGVTPDALLGASLAAFDAHVCSRAIVIQNLPVATISFVSALGGFLMACELVKDRLGGTQRRGPLDGERPVLRLDTLYGLPGPACVESYVPRRDCVCRTP